MALQLCRMSCWHRNWVFLHILYELSGLKSPTLLANELIGTNNQSDVINIIDLFTADDTRISLRSIEIHLTQLEPGSGSSLYTVQNKKLNSTQLN